MHATNGHVRILHLSDLHFGPPFVREVGNAVLRLAPKLDADAIVISGDFTERATRQQFQSAAEFLSELPDVPQLCVPGNHDVPLYRLRERLLTPHQLYREYISNALNPVLELEHAVIVGLDSTAPGRTISNGRIHQWQLDIAEEIFAAAPSGGARIVVAHHHFAPAPNSLYDRSVPKAKRAIMRFVEDDVDIVLGGHQHRAYIGNTLDIYPGIHRERGIVIVQSGTTTSRRGRGREREKNSLNVIDIDDREMKITHYLYFNADAGFVPASRHIFARGMMTLAEEPPPSPSGEQQASSSRQP